MQISNQELMRILVQGERYTIVNGEDEEVTVYHPPTKYSLAAARLIEKLYMDNNILYSNYLQVFALLTDAHGECETLRMELKNAVDSKHQQNSGTVSCTEPGTCQ
jgi:hypothetical protein